VRFVEDFTRNEFGKKLFHSCERLLKKGREPVPFTKGNLFVNGRAVSATYKFIDPNIDNDCLIFFSLPAKASATVHREMILCVSNLLVQSCISANFVNNSLAANFFIFAVFLTVIFQTSYYSQM